MTHAGTRVKPLLVYGGLSDLTWIYCRKSNRQLNSICLVLGRRIVKCRE
jgi:hypothetical protein